MKKFLITLFAIFFAFPALADYKNYYLNRTSIDSSGFASYKAAESWYPKNITLKIDLENRKAKLGRHHAVKFYVRGDNRRMEIYFQLRSSAGHYNLYKIYFLPNGQIHTELGPKGGFKTAGGGRYYSNQWNGYI